MIFPLNSHEPLNEPQNGLKENGQYLISEIEYAKDAFDRLLAFHEANT